MLLKKWTTFGLSEHEEILIKSMMRLVEGKSGTHWRHCTSFEVDLAFCNPSAPLSKLALERHTRAGKPICVMVNREGQDGGGGGPSIRVPVRHLEFMSVIQDVIANASGAISSLAETSANPEQKTKQDDGEPSLDSSFIVRFHSLVKSGACQIQTPDFNLQLDFRRRFFTSNETNLKKISLQLTDPFQQLSIEPGAIDSSDLPTGSIDALLWQCGLQYSSQQLVPWLRDADSFQLRHWPDFGALVDGKQFIGVAALFISASYNIEDASGQTGMAPADIRRFLNAAALCGLGVDKKAKFPTRASSNMPVAATNRTVILLNKIRSALKLNW